MMKFLQTILDIILKMTKNFLAEKRNAVNSAHQYQSQYYSLVNGSNAGK